MLSAYDHHDPDDANILIFPPCTTYIIKNSKGRLNKFFPDNWTRHCICIHVFTRIILPLKSRYKYMHDVILYTHENSSTFHVSWNIA